MVGEIGQVGLFWGSHLGSLRSQAMISWDYDADIAVFLQYSGSAKSRFSQVWDSAFASLRKMGYACHSHTNGGKGLKLRIAPLDPKNWNEFQELRQSMAEEGGQLASRPKRVQLYRRGRHLCDQQLGLQQVAKWLHEYRLLPRAKANQLPGCVSTSKSSIRTA